MPDISVCIPTYEYKGKGVKFLSELFDSLERQTFKDFNVFVSDHSLDEEIFNFCKTTQHDLDIIYIKNLDGRGYQATNTNCALKNADGKILKLIYQDDLFVDDFSLQKIKDSFEKTNCKWLFHGFTHTSNGIETHRNCVPKWCDMMLEGRNFLGSPSCLAILNGYELEMDENIKLLIDTELYHRMRMKYGMPEIISDILIANREHDNRTSSNIQYDAVIEHPEGSWMIDSRELSYIIEKHKNFCVNRKYPDEN